MAIDLDSLLAPLDNAITTADARAAVWPILRSLRSVSWYKREPVLRDIIAALDAAAWQAGCSARFRARAICPVYADLVLPLHDDYAVIDVHEETAQEVTYA